MKTPPEVLTHLRRLEADATPGPWIATGHELFFGREVERPVHVQIPCAGDAAFIAVARSWLADILDDYMEMQAHLKGLL